MRRWTIQWGVVLTLLAMILTACGETEPAGPVSADITMTDGFTFDPSLITVGRGAQLTVNAMNASTLNVDHDLIVLDGIFENLGDIRRAIEENPDVVLADTGVVSPGESKTVVLTLDEPGDYQIFCSIQGHFAAGMAGTITVDS